MSKESSLSLGAIKIFISTILSSVFNFFRIIIIAHFLGPSNYGYWNLLLVIFTYSNYTNLGIIDGMNKQIPYLIGQGKVEEAKEAKNVSFWQIVVLISFFSSVLVFVTLFFLKNIEPQIRYALLLLAILMVINQIYIVLTTLLRTEKKFGILAKAVSIINVSSFVGIYLLLQYKSLLSFVVTGMIIGNIITVIYIFYKSKFKFPLTFNRKLTVKLFKIGFPLVIIQVIYSLFISVDRWMIVGFLDASALGLYGLGATISTFMFGAFSVLSFTIFPSLMERFGHSEDITAAKSLMVKSNQALVYIVSIVIPLTIIVLPLALHYLLPDYIPALGVITLMISGVFFSALMTINGNYLVSINKQSIILYIQLFTLLINVILNYLALQRGMGIIGVATVTLISYCIYSSLVIIFSQKYLFSSLKTAFGNLSKLYLPYVISLSLGLKLMFSITITNNLWFDIKTTLINIFIFSLWGVILLFLLHKTIDLKQLLKALIPAKKTL